MRLNLEMARSTFVAPVWLDPNWVENYVLCPQLQTASSVKAPSEPLLVVSAFNAQLAQHVQQRQLDRFLLVNVPMFRTPDIGISRLLVGSHPQHLFSFIH